MESMVGQILGSSERPALKVMTPAALWGLIVHKPADDREAGVTIKAVLPGSAAAKAGLKASDRLLTLDGRWTDTVADCYAAAGYVKPAVTVTVVVLRDGKETEVSVTPASGL
jgi:S1-C subfamily serine protease